jgi:hypothetical protein
VVVGSPDPYAGDVVGMSLVAIIAARQIVDVAGKESVVYIYI